MRGLARAGKRAGEMAFNAGGGVVNWFPGHMAAALRAIRDRLKLADLVLEVRDARIPLSSANEDLQPVLASKRRYKIANQPSIYVLDTPGVLVPSIPDMETGLKLALTGATKDSVVGEERIAKYLLSLLNIRKTPLHWERLVYRREEFDEDGFRSNEKDYRDSPRRRQQLNNSDALYVQDMVMEVQRTLCSTFMDFVGNTEDENELESLVDSQLVALRKVFRIHHKPFDERHGPASKKLLTLFRSGKLGPFILDDLPDDQ